MKTFELWEKIRKIRVEQAEVVCLAFRDGWSDELEERFIGLGEGEKLLLNQLYYA